MANHPSLVEVLQKNVSYEWLKIKISDFFIGDFVDAENEKGEISSPSFSLFTNAIESEHGTYSFQNATIDIVLVEEALLQNLEGEFPLGTINIHDNSRAFITIKVAKFMHNNLMSLISSRLDCIQINIGVPLWDDANTKLLPLLKYQILCESEN